MKRLGIGAAATAAAVLVSATPALAQQPGAAPAVPSALADSVAAQAFAQAGGKFTAPECSADKGLHFKVNSGKTYLKTAVETPLPENKHRALVNSQRVITEAITQNDQGRSGGAWYYLGWTDLFLGDLAGADSALTKAEQLAPDCKPAIAQLRRLPYAPLYNAGVTATKHQQPDSAAHYFRLASQVNPTAPEAPYSLGTAFLQQKQYDSAAAYLQKTVELATTPERAKMRTEAQYNLAFSLLEAKRPKEAIEPARAYVQANPNDADGKKLLATVYQNAGMADSARAIQAQIVSSSGGSAGAGVGSGDVMAIGVQAYKEKRYPDAAKAFTTVLAKEPYNHDALYNLANVYLASNDGANLVKTAERIVAMEPMSEYGLKLLRQGYVLTKQKALGDKIAERALALPVDVSITGLAPSEAGMTVTLTATGRDAMTLTGKPVAPAAQTVSFEFLDASGGVVGTQETTIPALKPKATETITVQGQGNGIVAVRYHKK